MDRESVEEALRYIAITLERWASESQAGGWSTHQIKSQRSLAKAIFEALGCGDFRRITKETE